MIVGLDSATPPTPAQAQAAKDAGVGMWAVYISTKPNVGLYRSWSDAEIEVVRIINANPIAYFSGWDDPVAIRAKAARLHLRSCLDVENGIRGDGPWVQQCVIDAQSGLYGNKAVHTNRTAAFHIASWYVIDPGVSWPSTWTKPLSPCGWQWQNTHNEFGVGVDRSYLDDWFGGGNMTGLTTADYEFFAQGLILQTVGRTATDQAQLDGVVSALKNQPWNKVIADYANTPEAIAYRAKINAVAPDLSKLAKIPHSHSGSVTGTASVT